MTSLADALKREYAKYGWIDEASSVSQPPDKSVNVPGGAWSMRECCANRTDQCMYTVCESIEPREVSWQTLNIVHPQHHLDILQTDREELYSVFEIEGHGRVTEGDVVNILTPARRDVGGVVLAAALAYVYGFALTFCGGHHHASTEVSEGAGIFADVPLSWLILRDTIQRLGIKADPIALYIDVDVHHANGFAHARDEIPGMRDHFFMVDLYNQDIYPLRNGDEVFDDSSLEYLSIAKPFHSGTGTRQYLALLRDALDEAERTLPRPDIIYYMANNDILKGDPLGNANVTPDGIYKRDKMILEWAIRRNIPLVMLSGNGYAPNGCRVTRDSLLKLNEEFGLWEVPARIKKAKRYE